MITQRQRLTTTTAAALAVGLAACSAEALTTSGGQNWPFTPDAWTRGNDADTSYFGWDVLEVAGPPDHGGQWILDDGTPDLGSGITATSARIHQGADGTADPSPTANGHVSGSGNYYSFFDTANDRVTATAPASGSGGHTTVVLQLISSLGGDELSDLQFSIDSSVDTWTLQKHLHNTNGDGLGLHWVEWTAPGAGLKFSIDISSFAPHRAIDAFQIDTRWSAAGPAINGITVIPEPAGWLLAVAGLAVLLSMRRLLGHHGEA